MENAPAPAAEVMSTLNRARVSMTGRALRRKVAVSAPLLALALAICAMTALAGEAGAVTAVTFRWSSQGDYLTADPHARNEGLNNLINDHVYERLTVRGKKLDILPALAESWTKVNDRTWRFNLRKGVKFHDGTPFTADDVVFSFERAQSAGSNFKVFAAPLGKARRIDDLTVEFVTAEPHPAFMGNLVFINIMSRKWASAHGAIAPQDYKNAEETHASRHANGTGPFRLISREPEVKTVLAKNTEWWGIKAGRFEGNVTDVRYLPIKSDATRMSALITGEVDFVLDPPLQDIPRLKREPRVKIIEGPENRVIFLGMDQGRDELAHSNVRGRNPFKDARVRHAITHAIDIEAIRTQVMRGFSQPTGSIIVPASFGYRREQEGRLPFDVERARNLLREAGYASGFEVTMDCPNNRYVNDERICTAIAAMLARVGIQLRVIGLPRAQFFQKLERRDSSFFLYGWGGAPSDGTTFLTPIAHSFDGKGRGDFNMGRFSDPDVDRAIERASVEMDDAKRETLLAGAAARIREQAYMIPLHRQVIPWAARTGVDVVHRMDNVLGMIWVVLPPQ
jgi:peptide/nickel transport system substrate-binding protein